ncbi:IS3 family transposase [Paenibacillus sp. FSL R7-0337]|uniref:IS3 family transposase n=1 Tax=Paenibacillus sp. FSL R7-0337 TaxID=1926588 RepID=UPI0015C36E93|nr:IS3 family transposase [Paenibacillus sp. FSL R7-0337]
MLNVSRSGFYKWREKETSPQAERKAKLLQRISYHFKDNQSRYGSPKITKLLQREGYTVSERTVGKYMQELGLRSCVAKRFRVNTTDSNHDLPIAPNLLNQEFKTDEPNRV